MFAQLARAVFGNANDRSLKEFRRRLPAINALEAQMQALNDQTLAGRTEEFRARLAEGATLDSLLPEAFAVVREASRRVMGMRHFDVQLIGGMVLHAGKIAEMRTGEGKTLVATLAVYLNALEGKGVHVVTVNDYLASRDAEQMSQLYGFLGLSTGVIVANMSDEDRRAAYHCDITYGTNNEFGFDYLRDNMKYSLVEMVQRPFNFAIVDEVDSILIDEARTPLIISGPADDSSELYMGVDGVVAELIKDPSTFEKEEKFRTVILTEEGTETVERLLQEAGLLHEGGLYDTHNVGLVHHVQQSLRAHTLFSRDVDYIVREGKVVLIDEFTGRMMDGRRYSEGLHQALEAKEHVEIQQENQTLASITFQNYFRLYPKLSGMTGTALTEADEFAEIYKLDVIAIPTNLPVQRKDEDDEIYLTAEEKYQAVADLIQQVTKTGQPILVGTTSIEKSEHLSSLLKRQGIKHNVLNARFHEMEATIVAQAGAPGAITIATNMAGRGTDIKLGGNVDMRIAQEVASIEEEEARKAAEESLRAEMAENHTQVKQAGGLFVIGTERHESRRVDNQLRGRSGRQGDPGNSRFFLSLEDDLMRIFGSERMGGMLQKLGLKPGEAIVHPWINKALEKAQKKVEARNFDMRKNTLKYDDVMNDQRKEVYAQRREFMAADNVSNILADMRAEVITEIVGYHIPEKSFSEQWDIQALHQRVLDLLGLDLPIADWVKENEVDAQEIAQRIEKAASDAIAHKEEVFGSDIMRYIEKQILLTTLDAVWKEHLLFLDHLRQGIGLRAYGQKDPLNEYKQEAFRLFTKMLEEMRERVTMLISRVELAPAPADDAYDMGMDPTARSVSVEQQNNFVEGFAPLMGAGFASQETAFAPFAPHEQEMVSAQEENFQQSMPEEWRDTPRNALCPCGSGKKFKHCHGRLA